MVSLEASEGLGPTAGVPNAPDFSGMTRNRQVVKMAWKADPVELVVPAILAVQARHCWSRSARLKGEYSSPRVAETAQEVGMVVMVVMVEKAETEVMEGPVRMQDMVPQVAMAGKREMEVVVEMGE